LRIRDGNGDGLAVVDLGAVEGQAITTASNVSVSGRVATPRGRGVKGVIITMVDSAGLMRTTQTSSFGYYRFEDVSAGETIVLSARGKQLRFREPSIIRTVKDQIVDADFITID
jgi:hypothetical protein